MTALGKAIGAAIMMVGPALSAGALAEKEAPAQLDPTLGGKLDAILEELKKLNAALPSLR